MKILQKLALFILLFLFQVEILSCTSENSYSELCESGTVYFINNAKTYILIPTTAPQYCAYVSKGGGDEYFVGRIGSGTIGPFPNIKKALDIASIRKDKWFPISKDFLYDGISLVNLHTGDKYKKLCTREDYNKDIKDKFKISDFTDRHYGGLFVIKPSEVYRADIYLTNSNGNLKGTMNLSGRMYRLNGNYILNGHVDISGNGDLEVYNRKNILVTSLRGKISEYDILFKQPDIEQGIFISALDPKYKNKYD